MKFTTKVIAGAALVVFASASYGASVRTIMSNEGAFQLEDDSGEYHIDDGGGIGGIGIAGDGILDVGEKLRGIVEFPFLNGLSSGNTYNLDGTTNEHLSAIFEVEVISKVFTGVSVLGFSEFTFTFGPSASFAAELGGSAAGTLFKFYTDNSDDVDILLPIGSGGMCQTAASILPGGTCEGTVSDGAWLMDVGFSGLDADEGWKAFNAPELTGIGATQSVGTVLGNFNYNVSLLANSGSPLLLNQVGANLAVAGGIGDGGIDFTGSGSLLGTTDGGFPVATKLTAYHFTDDADAIGNAVPEPSSIALFGLAILGLAGASRRKVK